LNGTIVVIQNDIDDFVGLKKDYVGDIDLATSGSPIGINGHSREWPTSVVIDLDEGVGLIIRIAKGAVSIEGILDQAGNIKNIF